MRMHGVTFLLLCHGLVCAQDPSLPYREIPDHAGKFTAGTVTSRMVDGLGFRYYWATEGLRPEDLAFRPGPEARTAEETISHIHGLSTLILNATTGKANVSGGRGPDLSFKEMRRSTLENLRTASDNLRKASDAEMETFTMVFQSGADTTALPFWNCINGPIADALWHVGQIVSFRRTSGNPFTEKANVLTGKVRQ